MICFVNEKFFEECGKKKTIEGRLNKDKWSTINIGDLLTIKCGNKEKNCKIIAIHKEKSFKDLYEKFGEKLLPNECLEENEDYNIYYNFYSKKDEKDFGVLGIEIVLI